MKSLIKLFGTLTIFSVAFYLSGCENHNPTSPLKQNPDTETADMIVQSNKGPIQILQVDAKYLKSRSVNSLDKTTLSRSIRSDSLFYVEKFIEEGHGGKLEIDAEEYGKSKLEIKQHALRTDMTVYMEWPNGNTYEGEIGTIECGTLVYMSKPAGLELSYARANLAGIDESNLALFMYNENTGQWDNLNAEVRQGEKEVKAEVTRLGRIGIFEIKNGGLSELYLLDPNVYFVKKFIRKLKGGKVEVGDHEVGKSKLDFKKHDLPEDVTISFAWAPSSKLSGMLNNLEFGPHGLQFNNPVECKLSYKMADLTGIPEDSLQVFYYNDETHIWELIGGTVNKDKKYVSVFLNHFSRYAVAISR